MNKLSHYREKEINDRGFDIFTNDPITGPEASKTMYQNKVPSPRKAWSKAMLTVNRRKNQ